MSATILATPSRPDDGANGVAASSSSSSQNGNSNSTKDAIRNSSSNATNTTSNTTASNISNTIKVTPQVPISTSHHHQMPCVSRRGGRFVSPALRSIHASGKEAVPLTPQELHSSALSVGQHVSTASASALNQQQQQQQVKAESPNAEEDTVATSSFTPPKVQEEKPKTPEPVMAPLTPHRTATTTQQSTTTTPQRSTTTPQRSATTTAAHETPTLLAADCLMTPTARDYDDRKQETATYSAFDSSNVLKWLHSPYYSSGGGGFFSPQPPSTPRRSPLRATTPVVSTSFFFSDAAALPKVKAKTANNASSLFQDDDDEDDDEQDRMYHERNNNIICISPLANNANATTTNNGNPSPMMQSYSPGNFFQDMFNSPLRHNLMTTPRRHNNNTDKVCEDDDLNILLQLAGNTINHAAVFRSSPTTTTSLPPRMQVTSAKRVPAPPTKVPKLKDCNGTGNDEKAEKQRRQQPLPLLGMRSSSSGSTGGHPMHAVTALNELAKGCFSKPEKRSPVSHQDGFRTGTMRVVMGAPAPIVNTSNHSFAQSNTSTSATSTRPYYGGASGSGTSHYPPYPASSLPAYTAATTSTPATTKTLPPKLKKTISSSSKSTSVSLPLPSSVPKTPLPHPSVVSSGNAASTLKRSHHPSDASKLGVKKKKKFKSPEPEDRAKAAATIHLVNMASGGKNDKAAETAAASLRGVTMRPSGKWQAQLYFAGKSRYIGVFDNREKAALAYEIAREKLKLSSRSTKDAASTEQCVNQARKAAFDGVNEPFPPNVPLPHK